MNTIDLYYITDYGEGAYVEGYLTDRIYNSETCVIVPKKPTDGGYVYNVQSGQWELTIDSQQNYIRGFRNPELLRTDKYLLSDYPISAEDLVGAKIYRQTLRDVPDKETPQEMVMPECPPYLKPIP